MYLIDTNVITEFRKAEKADAGVREFFSQAARDDRQTFLASVTIGELRRGVEILFRRGDLDQAGRLEKWLEALILNHQREILPLDVDAAQIWGRLRVPDPHHALDKQIAAIALIWDLTVVTRNVSDFQDLGVKLLNPFSSP